MAVNIRYNAKMAFNTSKEGSVKNEKDKKEEKRWPHYYTL